MSVRLMFNNKWKRLFVQCLCGETDTKRTTAKNGGAFDSLFEWTTDETWKTPTRLVWLVIAPDNCRLYMRFIATRILIGSRSQSSLFLRDVEKCSSKNDANTYLYRRHGVRWWRLSTNFLPFTGNSREIRLNQRRTNPKREIKSADPCAWHIFIVNTRAHADTKSICVYGMALCTCIYY